ncbi:MAG: hypothetical protein LBL92_06245 [Propionibacteriaceae bacterium]|jgi:hypothetical protein|nr:hypothetical protein [Propionibacteriaceae bacterium]
MSLAEVSVAGMADLVWSAVVAESRFGETEVAWLFGPFRSDRWSDEDG